MNSRVVEMALESYQKECEILAIPWEQPITVKVIDSAYHSGGNNQDDPITVQQINRISQSQ